MSKQHNSHEHTEDGDEGRNGQKAPNPMKTDVGRTDDAPRETAASGKQGMAGNANSPKGSTTM